MTRLRTALLFQRGNFVGREYFARLAEAGLEPDLLVSVGAMAPESIQREIDRTGGGWMPADIPTSRKIHGFEKTSDPSLARLIRGSQIDVAIQGGVGILKRDMIEAPSLGILNVHPGRLPQYRGNACPEWAIFNNDEVWATAHFIDEGIDTGPIVTSGRCDVEFGLSYEHFRAGLYAQCAKVLVAAIRLLTDTGRGAVARLLQAQGEAGARYWPAMQADEFKQVKSRFSQPERRA